MSEPITPTPVAPQEQPDLDQLILKIPAKRWFFIKRALDMPTGEILEDLVAQLVVGANEKNRQTNGGKDDFARFLDMTFEDLSEFVGIDVPDGEDVDGSKSDAAPADGGGGGGDQPAAVDGAGRRAGVLDGEGGDLSGVGDEPS